MTITMFVEDTAKCYCKDTPLPIQIPDANTKNIADVPYSNIH
jgi:hypothetical protein